MTRPGGPPHRPEPPHPPSLHQPARPNWRCVACADPWPCSRRRAEIRIEFDGSRVLLALYMARYLGEALDDQSECSASDLYDRFLGWFHDPRR